MISRFFDLKGLAPCGDHLAKTHLTKTHADMVSYKGAFAWMTLKI